MTAPSVALVHVPGQGSRAEIRQERRKERRERRLRLFIAGITGVGAVFLGATIVVNLWPDEDDSGASEVRVDIAPPPTTAPPLLPEPVAVTPTTQPAWTTVTVDLPDWDGTGQLLTDGFRHPRLLPGETGRSIVQVPIDPTKALTFNMAERQWRVITRSTVPAAALGGLVGPQPLVPTVVLVGSGVDPLPWVEAR